LASFTSWTTLRTVGLCIASNQLVGVDLAQIVERDVDDRKRLGHSDSRATFQPSWPSPLGP
jgi:hypothetical protein